MTRQVDKYLFDRPEIWESINQSRFRKEPTFILEVFRRHGSVSRLLDVGCGTGGHLEHLSELGTDGLGVDLNERMIAFARQSRPHLKFAVADMRSLEFVDEFDAVTCLCTTFCYNTTNQDVGAALRGFHQALRPRGLVLIDVFNPITFIEARSFAEKLETTWEAFGLRSETTHTIDALRQVLIARQSVYTLEGDRLVQADVTEFRLFFPQELRSFLESTGFQFLDFYGGMDVADQARAGSRLIVVARKV